MLSTEHKQTIIQDYQKGQGDTGSSEVQVALLTERIKGLTDHLRRNHKDHSTRRGLLKLVGQRRRLLRYVADKNVGNYRELISRLGLRR
jgi:small subunit ribosomal protein S15